MIKPVSPVTRGSTGRRAAVGLAAGVALALGGLAVGSTAAFADSGTIATTLSGAGEIGHETYSFTEGALSGQATFSANGSWSQPAVVSVDWDPDEVRQGRALDPTVELTRPVSGTMSITYQIDASLTLATDPFGDLTIDVHPSITASGACNLLADGSTYSCHLESSDVGVLDPPLIATGFPYLNLKMVSDVTVTSHALDTLRMASTASQDLASGPLSLGEGPQVDPMTIDCRVPVGDQLSYGLGDLASTPGLHVVSSVGIEAGFVSPPIPPTPFGVRIEVYSDTVEVATSDASLDVSGPGGTIGLGAIQANNIPPTLGAVSAPDGTEGTPIQFSTSATGPCAAGATYSWDFGDGSGPGHTATPQHVYADDGVWTGQVVVTDETGLTDTADFTVHVANAAPNVTVVPGAPVTVPWGKPLTLKAQAVDPGAADQSTLTYDWAFGDGDSIDNGGTSATHSWSVIGDPSPTVTVCDKDGACTVKQFTVHVRKHATELSYTGPQAADHSSIAPLTASLVDEFGTPLNGAPVAFAVDGSPVGTAMTDASGRARLDYPVVKLAGAHTVSASYVGNPTKFEASATTGDPFAVSAMASELTYTGGLKGSPNKAVTVSAKLVDALGRPLAGRTVTFVIGSQQVSATTASSGIATAQLKLVQKPGFYPLTVSWAGDAGRYLGDSVTLQFSLNKK